MASFCLLGSNRPLVAGVSTSSSANVCVWINFDFAILFLILWVVFISDTHKRDLQWKIHKRRKLVELIVATEIWVDIGSGNGLLPNGTNPLPKPMLINHQWGLHLMPNLNAADIYFWYDFEAEFHLSTILNLRLNPHFGGINELITPPPLIRPSSPMASLPVYLWQTYAVVIVKIGITNGAFTCRKTRENQETVTNWHTLHWMAIS